MREKRPSHSDLVAHFKPREGRVVTMRNCLKNPVAWLFITMFVTMFGWYIVVPVSLLIADKAEERVVVLNDQSRSIFIEWDTKRVRLPAGMMPSALFEENGKVRKNTYFPPARFIPKIMVIIKDATPQETALYRQLFPAKS
ncbi:MAG: hypothetical protein Q7R91_01240 [bacterium]|nr:hypothetical protein [bacterium]